MSNELEWHWERGLDDYDPKWRKIGMAVDYDRCKLIPKVFFEQTVVWQDSRGRLWPIPEIQEDHLHNLISWIVAHASHWRGYNVLTSPLYKALSEESDRRLRRRLTTTTTKPPTLTTRGATGHLRTVLLEDYPKVAKRGVSEVASTIIAGLRKRGYAIYQIPGKEKK